MWCGARGASTITNAHLCVRGRVCGRALVSETSPSTVRLYNRYIKKMTAPNGSFDAAPTVEEVRVQQLKRKLQALHYTDPFDTTSLSLVDKVRLRL